MSNKTRPLGLITQTTPIIIVNETGEHINMVVENRSEYWLRTIQIVILKCTSMRTTPMEVLGGGLSCLLRARQAAVAMLLFWTGWETTVPI